MTLISSDIYTAPLSKHLGIIGLPVQRSSPDVCGRVLEQRHFSTSVLPHERNVFVESAIKSISNQREGTNLLIAVVTEQEIKQECFFKICVDWLLKNGSFGIIVQYDMPYRGIRKHLLNTDWWAKHRLSEERILLNGHYYWYIRHP